MLDKLNKMKVDKSFKKDLFKPMEENINLIYKENFEASKHNFYYFFRFYEIKSHGIKNLTK